MSPGFAEARFYAPTQDYNVHSAEGENQTQAQQNDAAETLATAQDVLKSHGISDTNGDQPQDPWSGMQLAEEQELEPEVR